eukprot:TRINITY_DN14782_c0_g1_i1.p1 TRINITY_DN14782_c0_g1~~TRINITY_DN14782_c0_g1_i1.p1  ORF type:complete len:390 (+),score=73.31 TRINITY_DN14782_c0_g1_i1:170-1339(+)
MVVRTKLGKAPAPVSVLGVAAALLAVFFGGRMTTMVRFALPASRSIGSMLRGGRMRTRCTQLRCQSDASRGATLLLASETDPASENMVRSLLVHEDFQWVEHGPGKWFASALKEKPVYLWKREMGFRQMDHVDTHWEEKEGRIDDVVFLSLHKAESGKPSLTVHPIGNPRRDVEARGGASGQLVPPSPRLNSMRIALHETMGEDSHAEGLADYDVTFEATHHGPFLKTPSLFAEIGSSEAQWSQDAPGRCWASALWTELSRPSTASDKVSALVIGGNHYMSQVNAVADRHPEVLVGHMLPSYVLQDAPADEIRHTVQEAVEKTAEAMSKDAKGMVVFVFKKKLKSTERRAVLDVLKSYGGKCPGGDQPLEVVTSTTDFSSSVEAMLGKA